MAAKINLSELNVEELMDLRERVEGLLSERRAELQEQLERIAVAGGRRVVRGGASALRGRKVPPKYRVVDQATRGQAVGQDLVGLLLRSRVERNSMIS